MGKAATARIRLPDHLDIKAAGPLALELTAARGNDVVLDASGIERVGGQCLQVLISAAATWTVDGAELVIDTPSPAFVDAIRIAGLDLTQFSVHPMGRH